MIEITGDFAKKADKYEALVCTTNKVVMSNDRLVMGAGIAKWFRDKYRDLDYIWGFQLQKNPQANVMCLEYKNDELDDGQWLIALPTKTDWKKSSSYSLIETGLQELVVCVNALGIQSVLMTRPGCGNGGLDWETFECLNPIYHPSIKILCQKHLDNRFTIINKG